MHKLRGLADTHRATITSATKRAEQAEQLIKLNELLVKKKLEELDELDKRQRLLQQYVKLAKDLETTRQKLNEAENSLIFSNDKASHFEARIHSLNAESDIFESKYQKSRKRDDELICEMESLRFN